jgi:hypothetical protein
MQQGSYLPRKLQKRWKKHLSTYHLIRKAIHIINHTTNWYAHPVITRLQTHPHAHIPPPPDHPHPHHEWLTIIANIVKTAHSKARQITTNHAQTNVLKAINKCRQL